MTTGNCAPLTEPGATIDGLEVIVTTSRLFGPLGPVPRVHVALVPQMMSETVGAFPPAHAAGPALVTGPQSLSVTQPDSQTD